VWKLEPEQEQRLIAELEALSPAIQKAVAELADMIEHDVEYPHVTGVVDNTLQPGSQFEHILHALQYFEEDGCSHFRAEMHSITTLFFMLGREVERQQIPCTPTILVRKP
jgi:hypothetical protein